MANPGPASTVTPIFTAAYAGAANPSTWGMLAQSSVAIIAPTDSTEDILATVNLPALQFGLNGQLRIFTSWTCTNNVNVKTARIRLGGIAGTVYMTVALTSLAGAFGTCYIQSTGVNSAQQGEAVMYTATPGVLVTAPTTGALDLTVPQTLVITSQKATAGDVVTLTNFTVEGLFAQ